MKFWAKINRGLVLVVIVLVVVGSYLVVLTVSDAFASPEIESVCKDYIKTAVSYSMLPQQYRNGDTEMPRAEFDSYINSMEGDIKAFYPNNEQAYKYVLNQYKTSLENQAGGTGMVYSYSKEVASFTKLDFNGDTVTVSILSNTSYNGPASSLSASSASSPMITTTQYAIPSTGQTTDTIKLQRIDGKWDVVYADLEKPNAGQTAQ